MEPLSPDTLTILVLVGVILSGVAFIGVSILIICLLYKKYGRSNIVRPVNTRSRTSSDSYDSRPSSASSYSSSSVSSIPVKSSAITSTKREEPEKSQLQKYRSDSISIIDEHPSNNQKKHQQVYDETTIKSESRIDTQRHKSRRQQQSVKPTTNVQFLDRRTPYPADVIARERVMMSYHRLPIDGQQ